MASLLLAGLLLLLPQDPAGDGYPRDPNIDIVHYAFGLTLSDATDQIEGDARVTVRFASDGVRDFALDLVGGMAVASVSEDGGATSFEHVGDRLRLALTEPSRSGQERTFEIRYAGTPSDGLIISENKHGDRTFFGDNWPNRARQWLPTVDHPHDKATVEWLVTAPNHYQVVGTGELVEETDLDDETRFTHWRSAVPIATKVMVMGAARFAVQHADRVGDVPIQSWIYPQDRNAGFFDYALAGRVTRFFVDRVGPFPYEKLANVQSKTRFGGMENAGNIFYSENSVRGDRSSESLLAHEIAHQWFGDSVTEGDWHHIWLSEGFATYFTQLYLEHTYGAERREQGMRQMRGAVLGYFDRNPESPVVDASITDLMRLLSTNSYQKGGWVLHMLRREIGDEAFWEGIRTYYREFRDGNALTGDLERVMERTSAKDLTGFFQQWVFTPGQPELSATWKWNAGVLTLDVRQTQSALFDVPLEIAFSDGDNEHRETVRIDEASESFRIPMERPPARVDLDPDAWLLMRAELKTNQ